MVVINRLKYYDWSFSNTAEVAVGTLLVIAMVVTTLVYDRGPRATGPRIAIKNLESRFTNSSTLIE